MLAAKKIRVLPFAKLQAILGAAIGIVVGIVYAVGGTIYDIATTGSANIGTAMAYMALVGMPIVFAAGGFVLGLIEAVLFNRFPASLRRVELEFWN